MKRQVVLYIAISLDGYIADPAGKVDWLAGEEPNGGGGYAHFLEGVDTVILGGTTYRQVVEELSPEVWPYEGLQSYVFTRRQEENREGIAFIAGDAAAFVRELAQRPGKGIWICGGAELVSQLLWADCIDRFQISVIPTLLGGGIRLFPEGIPPLPLSLVETRTAGGIVELTYSRRNA